MQNRESGSTYVINVYPFNIPKVEAELADNPPKNQSMEVLTPRAHFNQCEEETYFTQCPKDG